MDLCLMIEGQEGVTWPEWVALARACEEHGVPALFRSDHHLNLGGVDERGSLDAWAVINALAACTTSLHLGTLVSPVTFRHPSEVAKLVVAADHVSGGRVSLGLGAGWNEREHAAYGFPFPRWRADGHARRAARDRARAVDRVAFSFAGAHYSLDAVDAQPKPVQSPHPPLIMGGKAGPRAAALAARWADEYNTAFATLGRAAADEGAGGRGVRGGGARADPVLAHDRRARGARPGRVRGAPAAAGGARRALSGAWIAGTVDEVAEQLAHVPRRRRRARDVPAHAPRRRRHGRADRRGSGADALMTRLRQRAAPRLASRPAVATGGRGRAARAARGGRQPAFGQLVRAAVARDPAADLERVGVQDTWLADRLGASELGKTAGKRSIELRFFPGKTTRRALVIGGVHGTERQGVQVARLLEKDLAATPSDFSVLLVPVLFPDNAARGKLGIREEDEARTNQPQLPRPRQGPRRVRRQGRDGPRHPAREPAADCS
jgi:alkanesulfonate monooxygenase SsuD/methylene tetrahydromethanopterin reductase-like flavin-dependent oxidoreductase (luciferase family)